MLNSILVFILLLIKTFLNKFHVLFSYIHSINVLNYNNHLISLDNHLYFLPDLNPLMPFHIPESPYENILFSEYKEVSDLILYPFI